MDEYVERLDDLGLSLMVYDGEKVIFQSQSKGVRPHLEAIKAFGPLLSARE